MSPNNVPRFPNTLQTDWQTLESVSWQRCRRWMCEPRCRLKRRRYVWWLSNRLVLFFFFFFFPWMFSCRASKRHSSLEFLELVLWKCCKWTHTHMNTNTHTNSCCAASWCANELILRDRGRGALSQVPESYLPLPVRLKTHKSGHKHTETEKSSSSYTCDYGFWFFLVFFGSLKCLLTASRPVLKCHHLACELRYLISELKCFILQRDVLHLKTWWYKMISAMRGKKHIMSHESSGDCINLWKFFFVFEILFKLFFFFQETT